MITKQTFIDIIGVTLFWIAVLIGRKDKLTTKQFWIIMILASITDLILSYKLK